MVEVLAFFSYEWEIVLTSVSRTIAEDQDNSDKLEPDHISSLEHLDFVDTSAHHGVCR